MLLKPVAEIAVSIDGYFWDRSELVARCDNCPEFEDGTPAPPSRLDRQLQGLDRTYDPFEDEPGLFLRFAKLESTPDAIAEFATQYGNLEPSNLRYWKRTILRVRSAVELWEAVKRRTDERLLEHVRWDGPRLEIVNPLARHIIHSAEYLDIPEVMPRGCPPIPLGEYSQGELLRPAQDALEWIMRLGRFPGGKHHRRTTVAGRYRFEIRLTNLRDVLWLQWLMAVCENRTFHNCEHCGRPIFLVPEETRSDRRYCSNVCQMRAYRRRIAKAKQMRLEGQHLREIAKAVGSDMATVKKWVGEA